MTFLEDGLSAIFWNSTHWVKFKLKIGVYINFIEFLVEHDIFFIAENTIDFTKIPIFLHGYGESKNLLEYLANNVGNTTLIINFLKYFISEIYNFRYTLDKKMNFSFEVKDTWQITPFTVYGFVVTTTTTTTTIPPSLNLIFDDIANASLTIGGDASLVDDWNSFFDLPTYGTSFTRVEIDINTVKLYGGSGITFKDNLFGANVPTSDCLLEVVDTLGAVIACGEGVFSDYYPNIGCFSLTTVKLPSCSVIGRGAFYDDYALVDLILDFPSFTSLPEDGMGYTLIGGSFVNQFVNLESIGDGCFTWCPLTDLSLSKLTYAGNGCFGSTLLSSVNLPVLENVGMGCFNNCDNLVSPAFPALKTAGIQAFSFCDSLLNPSFPELLTIGDNCFRESVSLYQPFLPKLTTAGDYTFFGCSSLNVDTFESITSLGIGCFRDCISLTSTSFPALISITSNSVFSGTINLDTASFPILTTISGSYVFSGSKLTNAYFPLLQTAGESCFTGCQFSNPSFSSLITVGLNCFNNCDSLIDPVFPALENIGVNGFGDCSSLRNPSFPSLVIASDYCFSNCINLTNPNFPSLTSIGVACFANDINLVNPQFPAVTTIGNIAFAECYGLSNPYFPVLATIGNFTFRNCTSLTSISLPSCTSLGASVLNNGVFDGITGKTITLTIPSALMTCNSGNPDGDIQYLQANNTVNINITDAFITTWKTDNVGTSNSDQISIPLNNTYSYNFWVNWGDGTAPEQFTGFLSEALHTYSIAGTYTVSIYGNFPTIMFYYDHDYLKILSIEQWGAIEWQSMLNAFYGCENMVINAIDIPNTTAVTTFEEAFDCCYSITSFPAIDTSNCTNFLWAFAYMTSLTSFPEIDISQTTELNYTWAGCSSLTSFPLLNTSSCLHLNGTWSGCKFTSFPVLDTSNVININGTWSYCTNLTSFPLLDFSSVISSNNTWSYCTNLTSFPSVNLTSTTSCNSTWRDCTSLISFPALDLSNVTNFYQTWFNCNSLIEFPLVDISSATSLNAAWYNCTSLTTVPLLNTASVTNFRQAWTFCSSITSFGQINMRAMSNGDECFRDVTLPTTIYSNILIDLAANNVNNSVTFDAGKSKYDISAISARQTLTSAPKSWYITDGGSF